MVVLKSESQVRSFVKRQRAYHRENTDISTCFDDLNYHGIKTNVYVDRNKVLLLKTQHLSGDRDTYVCDVIAVIKIRIK